MGEIEQKRSILVKRIFPEGVPRLWCPLLTHYTADGGIDRERTAAHIRHMRPFISSFLAPGSTGDGWEMSAEESLNLVELLLSESETQGFKLMIGVLHTERGAAAAAVEKLLSYLGADSREAGNPNLDQLIQRNVCGFTVTPPKGAELSQGIIHKELELIARTGVPLALYQLPQVTENEMSPETFADLVSRFPNIYLFKDTSGGDTIAVSGVDAAGVRMVRGAEGDYANWLKRNDGYYGFLLSTANCFARELREVVEAALTGETEKSDAMSARVAAVVSTVFDAAATLPFGNPFANANKAMDHHFAHGPERAAKIDAPMTHSGNRLPAELLETAADALTSQGLYPERGYVE